jgi:hypothetical protein
MFAVRKTQKTERLFIRSQMTIRMTWIASGTYIRYFGEFSTFIEAVESQSGDTSLILSSFEDAVKTYDLTWRIREASEASTRELHGQENSSATLGAGGSMPSSLESTITPTAGPTSSTERATGGDSENKGLVASVKEGVEKLGLGTKQNE